MSDLSSALNRAAGARRAPEPAPPRKGLLLRLDPAMHKRLRLLAVQEDTTVQALGVEASAGDALSVPAGFDVGKVVTASQDYSGASQCGAWRRQCARRPSVPRSAPHSICRSYLPAVSNFRRSDVPACRQAGGWKSPTTPGVYIRRIRHPPSATMMR